MMALFGRLSGYSGEWKVGGCRLLRVEELQVCGSSRLR